MKKNAIDSIFFIIKTIDGGGGKEKSLVPPFRSKTENDQKLRSNTLLPTEKHRYRKSVIILQIRISGFPYRKLFNRWFLSPLISHIFYFLVVARSLNFFPSAVKVAVILFHHFFFWVKRYLKKSSIFSGWMMYEVLVNYRRPASFDSFPISLIFFRSASRYCFSISFTPLSEMGFLHVLITGWRILRHLTKDC